MRCILLVLPTVLMLLGGFAPGTPEPASAGSRDAVPRSVPTQAVVTYRLPLAGSVHVLRGFAPPATRYGTGHRGVDLGPPAGAVLAAAPGRVVFAGRVAGRGVVVIAHPDGVRTEYEPVHASVVAGAGVVGGQPIGTVLGSHRGCAGVCLHWGARRGDEYLDPLSLLRPLGTVRLLPWSGADSGAG